MYGMGTGPDPDKEKLIPKYFSTYIIREFAI